MMVVAAPLKKVKKQRKVFHFYSYKPTQQVCLSKPPPLAFRNPRKTHTTLNHTYLLFAETANPQFQIFKREITKIVGKWYQKSQYAARPLMKKAPWGGGISGYNGKKHEKGSIPEIAAVK